MTKRRFEYYVGIDYSGAKTATCRLRGIQVYLTDGTTNPVPVGPPGASFAKARHWCREEVAEFLIAQSRSGRTFIAGLDHGFSFPHSYFEKYRLNSWGHFLDDFCEFWPTDRHGVSVDSIRNAGPLHREGSSGDLRLTEKWTSSAKSVFLFDVQGSVAKSTHAGLPWLQRIRNEVGKDVHVWPFDGWSVPSGKSVLAEVYPSILRRRYASENRTTDQQDAYSVSRWLSDVDRSDTLSRYLAPPLNESDRVTASLEGWILGVV